MKFYLVLICFLFYSCVQFNWGNHFTFEIDSPSRVDSLGFKYCDNFQIFKLPYHEDSLNMNTTTFEGNIDPYHEVQPCNVSFLIYSKDEVIEVDGGVFDCFNCDGSHFYLINKDTVVYQFRH